jgi:hypothetical protein
MRKAIFYAVAEAVAAVPGVEFVDLWNDDGSHFSGGAVYPLPAVFVEFEAVEWKQQGMGAVARSPSGFMSSPVPC